MALMNPALVTVVEGKGYFQIWQNHALGTICLEPGDLLFRMPHSWITLEPKSDYRSLGVVMEAERIRFFFSRPVPATNSPNTYLDIQKTPYLYRQAGQHLVIEQLANVLPLIRDADSESPVLQDIMRAMIHCIGQSLHAPPPSGPDGKARTTFMAICSYIDEHCFQDISRDDVADSLDIHKTHVSRLFKRFKGQGFSSYLRVARLRKAQILLVNPTLNVSQIASMCGFNSANYFARVYRQFYSEGPLEYRKRQWGQDDDAKS